PGGIYCRVSPIPSSPVTPQGFGHESRDRFHRGTAVAPLGPRELRSAAAAPRVLAPDRSRRDAQKGSRAPPDAHRQRSSRGQHRLTGRSEKYRARRTRDRLADSSGFSFLGVGFFLASRGKNVAAETP